MSMPLDDLSAPTGDAVKFDTIGTTVKGTVTYIGPWQTRINKFNNQPEEVMRIVLDTVDGARAIYPKKGSPMAQAIAEAVRATGGTAFETGSRLAVRFDSEKPTDKGNPLKLYVAQYEAPKPAAKAVSASDLFD